MDILKLLKESPNDLYVEDLDLFETELATGGPYTPQYKAECMSRIRMLRTWMNDGRVDPDKDKSFVSKKESEAKSPGITVDLSKLVPEGADPPAENIDPAERVYKDLIYIRESESYKSDFKKYVADSDIIDAAFVDEHYSFFKPWEMNAILSVKQMGEKFLEKYFGALEHDKIARYQLFSENFFMKHFSQLDTSIVLERGKNEWRKKENRSKQLDVFLRLKGVKI